MIALASTIDTLIGSGGWAGLAGLIIFIGKQLFDSWNERRKQKNEDRKIDIAEDGAGFQNATTVNAIMTKSIESLHSENVRLVARNEYLEKAVDIRDTKIAERDATIESLKTSLQEWVAKGQEYVQEITTYQELLRKQTGEVE